MNFSYFLGSNACPNGWYQSIITTNNCYNFIYSTTDWFDAEIACKNSVSINGASLVSIDSAFENSEITGLTNFKKIHCRLKIHAQLLLGHNKSLLLMMSDSKKLKQVPR